MTVYLTTYDGKNVINYSIQITAHAGHGNY